MIVKKFNELSDNHLNFCRALEVLNKIDFMEDLPSMVESINGSSELEISVFDGNQYTVRMNSHRNGSVNIRVMNDSAASGTFVSLYFNSNGLLTATSNTYYGTSTSHSYLFLDERMIFEDGTVVTYENLKENAFQYSTVCPLAALILQYTNVG